MNQPLGMDIKGRVVGSDSVVGTGEVVRVAVLAMISHHEMNVKGRIVGSSGGVVQKDMGRSVVLTVISEREMNVEILVVMAVRVVTYEVIVRGVSELNRVRCAWWIGWA